MTLKEIRLMVEKERELLLYATINEKIDLMKTAKKVVIGLNELENELEKQEVIESLTR